MASGPLHGITIVDLTRVLAGPFSTMILGDLGARVIKIERPGRGDDTRRFGPPFLKDRDGEDTTEAAYYLAANRNKQSVTIDLTRPQGQAAVRRLLSRADILAENFKTDGLKRFGLAYEDLKDSHPRLIYCSITGFGHTGTYRERAGYDFLVQAMGGLMSITGEDDGLPGGGPLRVGVPISDILTGMYAAIAVLAALAHRTVTGEGQHLDIALLDATVATLTNQAMNYLTTGEVPGRIGNSHPNIVPYQAFATADGHVVVAIGNDDQFLRFAQAIGRPQLADDPRFASNIERVRNRAALIPEIAVRIAGDTTDAWLTRLEAASLPCGPINTLDQVFDHPQVQDRGMRIDMAHPLADSVPLVGSPLKLSASPVAYRLPPPLLGEHTDAVLSEVGYGDEEIASLREIGVL